VTIEHLQANRMAFFSRQW